MAVAKVADAHYGFGKYAVYPGGHACRVNLTRGRGRRRAAFGEDDVGRHQLLSRADVVARAFVDARELAHRRRGFVDGRAGGGVSHRLAKGGEGFADGLTLEVTLGIRPRSPAKPPLPPVTTHVGVRRFTPAIGHR